MTVLILTAEEDVTADLVVAELHGRGTPLVRFDPADLPGEASMSAEYVSGDFRGHLSAGGRLLSMDGLRSIWVRRPGASAAHAPSPSPWLTAESEHAFFGMLYSTTARWMNHPQAAAQARLKPWQLRVAHQSGFAVPPTLVTTFPRIARLFAAEHRDIVVKSITGPPPGDPPVSLPTTRVGPGADFESVSAGPTLLQRYISKRADIRLTGVGHQLFAARKVAGPGQVDGRYGESDHTWEPVEVPDRIARAVYGYLRVAHLAYGAFDFAEDTEGTWWFLECNQGGQFGFVELQTRQPIAGAVAGWLASPPPV
ncbi:MULTISPECIES: ATP-grasp ribosomal peptide maturase [Streptomyces]|uniref:ATP-grasp ribosomal peptide maturase n=1 Tax=Streptomyces niveus TaxID=193462 RepID=A0ABZ2ADL4_STRNV|nr:MULTISPECIES: ATP-grasp ribosomal peptide maturase [Streptomyces]EST18765.1 30S ribosomal protein S6 modification enzyme RimK [Streptomyces niveus NCIMB 11891]TFI20719.1 ATP-grasp ribosomal peptide maturase [Streptomyces sp. 4R-3d]